jgi:hypothetical protein
MISTPCVILLQLPSLQYPCILQATSRHQLSKPVVAYLEHFLYLPYYAANDNRLANRPVALLGWQRHE